jgi:hypothetical protein
MDNMKVAVIGAGFSGMLAAYLLEKNGIDVTVYEKQEFIGGHCRTLSSNGEITELGNVFLFQKHIKELLIDLKIAYSERFSYKNFVGPNYEIIEHIPRECIPLLMNELNRLKTLLDQYGDSLNSINYGYIHPDLLLPLDEFLMANSFEVIQHLIEPQLSSFGFGKINEIQAYYVLKIFNYDVLQGFILGEKLLFIDKGTSELIKQLSQNISDIRYSLEVTNIEGCGDKIIVETPYASDYYDKVLITTKLPEDVIKDNLYNQLMEKVDTTPFVTCAYEVSNKNLVTTYFKTALGQKDQLQFFYTSRQNSKTKLVAYAYGQVGKPLINNMTRDIERLGIEINKLMTIKQWHIFPHLKDGNLTSNFYLDILNHQGKTNIYLIGSLVTEPSLDTLYRSVKNTINQILEK